MSINKAKIPFDPARVPFFYGYIIFVCSSLGMLMSGPGQTIGVSAFTDDLVAHLGITRFELSLAYMIGTIASSFLIGRAGKLLDKYSVRRVVSVTVIGLGLFLFYMANCDRIAGIFGSSVVASMAVVTIGFWMIRFCGQGILGLSSRTMLMKWFDKKRGRINAFLGIFIVVTFSYIPAIFDSLKSSFGWRGTWVLVGCVAIAFSAFVLIFYRDKPEDCGLLPDGITEEEYQNELKQTSAKDREEEWEYSEVVHNYTFWIFNLSLAMYSLVITAVTFHVASIFEVAGRGHDEAFGMFKYAAIVGVIVNLSVGFLSDTKFFKHRLHLLLLGLIGGLILLLFGVVLLSNSSYSVTMIILGNGIASGVFGVLSSLVWPRYFGRTHLGQINGLGMAFMVFFSAIGPTIFGWSFEYFNGYSISSYILIAVMVALGIGSFMAVFPHRKKTGA